MEQLQQESTEGLQVNPEKIIAKLQHRLNEVLTRNCILEAALEQSLEDNSQLKASIDSIAAASGEEANDQTKGRVQDEGPKTRSSPPIRPQE